MDRPTFEALQRIMELIEPRSGAPAELREDWHRVAVWMEEAAEDIDDLETLGTGDPRRTLHEAHLEAPYHTRPRSSRGSNREPGRVRR